MNKVIIKTNILTEEGLDVVQSAFKADKRIWSLSHRFGEDCYILVVQSELANNEVLEKLTSIGLKAEVIEE